MDQKVCSQLSLDLMNDYCRIFRVLSWKKILSPFRIRTLWEIIRAIIIGSYYSVYIIILGENVCRMILGNDKFMQYTMQYILLI